MRFPGPADRNDLHAAAVNLAIVQPEVYRCAADRPLYFEHCAAFRLRLGKSYSASEYNQRHTTNQFHHNAS